MQLSRQCQEMSARHGVINICREHTLLFKSTRKPTLIITDHTNKNMKLGLSNGEQVVERNEFGRGEGEDEDGVER